MSDALLFLVTRPVLGDTPQNAQDAGFVAADANAPLISVFDLGPSRGDGIFESIGVTSGHPQAVEAHLTRLAASARLLDLPEPDLTVWRAAVHAAVAAHPPVAELLVKLVLTRGIEGTGVPTAWVYAQDSGDQSVERREGIRIVTLDRGYRSDVAQTSPWLLQGAKTLSYAVNRAAMREAIRRGADDVIFTSSDGYLLEGPTSNLLLRRGNVISTPRIDQGVLAGTTQASAFGFFVARGFETSYEALPVSDLETADAAWLVSSIRQAAPIRSVDGRELAIDSALSDSLIEYLLARQD